MEVKLKAVNIAPTVTTDVFFEDSTKWTVALTGPSTKNSGSFSNNDLNLQIGRWGTLPGNTVTVTNNGVVLDTTKEYLMFIKVNVNANYQGKFDVCGNEFKNLPVGKEIVRRFKPTTTDLNFKLSQTITNNSLTAKVTKDRMVIDYCRIVEYDVLYLDLYTTEPVLYQSNVKDIYEPDKIKSDYAKSFDIPGSKTNNQFFSHWYKVSARGDFDQNVKIPVVIQKMELDILEGYMVLNDVTINGSDVKYNISVIAEMANIWNDIETLKLKDLDLTKYNHSIDMKKLYVDLPEYGTISSPPSIDPGLVNTAYTFEASKLGVSTLLTMPNGTIRTKIVIANHGYSEGDFVRLDSIFYPNNNGSGNYFPLFSMCGDFVVEAIFDNNTFYINCNFEGNTSTLVKSAVRRINYTGDGWFYGFINRGHTTKNVALPTKSRPQLFLKGIFDKIFKESGYQYTSQFLNTNYFKSLCADLITKEITQLSDDLGSNNVEAKQTYSENNYMPGFGTPITDSKHFLKTFYFGPEQINPNCNQPFKNSFKSYSNIVYGTTYESDLIWGTELVDPNNLYSNGVFTPTLNGDYRMQAFITVGCSMANKVMKGQYILPQKQKFKQTSHWYGIDNDLDGTPASNDIWVYNTGVRDGNSGMVFWLEIMDITDNKSIWKSVEYLATPSARLVSKYDYNDCFVDINQTCALPLKKDHSYKYVLKYTRNQKLYMGAEPNAENKWKWAVSKAELDIFCTATYYTEKSSPSSFGNDSWSIWTVGNNQKTGIREGTSGNIKNITGYNYVKFELLQSIAEGSDVYIKHFVADMTQSEFLSSVNKMFNLHWAWDRNNKKYIIEPFYNFYNQTELDWTKKVNTKDEIKLEPLDNSKKYTLKYKDANDYYNKDYSDAFGSTYGESVIINSSEVATNETNIETGFSLGVLVQFPVDPLNTMIMPTYTTQNIGNGVVTDSNSGNGIFVYICGGKKYSKTPMTLDDGAVTATQVWEGTKFNYYPFVGHVDSTYAPYYDICFANPAQFSYIMKNYTTHNLYNKFWRDWFNLVLNRDQKKITYKINLTDTDIFNLDYSKRYIINKEPFRLVSISDHNLTANNIATAVFIKDISSKVFKTKTITYGGGDNPWDKDNEDTNWNQGEWSTDPYVFAGKEEWNPGSAQYYAVSSYQGVNSWSDSASSLSNAEGKVAKDKNFGNSAQFDSISMGTNNFDNGGDNFVSGDSNRIYGRGNFVSGMNNQVATKNAIIIGDNIRASRPGVYFQDVFIDPDGLVHNATNRFQGGFGETINYYESVNNLYQPNVLGRITGTTSPSNPFGGVLEIDNPLIQFTLITGTDIRYDEIRNF